MNPKMNARLIRRIIGLILMALLLTSILILSGTTAGAQSRMQRRIVMYVRPRWVEPGRWLRQAVP